MTMNEQVKQIQKILIAQANPASKAAHKLFVPGVEKVYGVRTPVLNSMASTFKDGGFVLVQELWKAGSLEETILAAKMLGKIAKQDPQRSLALVQLFAKNIGNWAVCDAIGMQALKPIVKSHQQEIFSLAKKFNSSTDLWQRRLSLVLVEWYTRMPALHPEINKLVQALEHDNEYYVRKAVVWIKKNFKKGK